jgi:hypothetical protein
MAENEIKSVGVFIDGGYYAKVDAALKKEFSKNINLKGLLDFVQEYICKMDGLRKDKLSITESHYYR